MLATELFESPSICPVCGCTPCNCTHIVEENEQLDEASYRNVLRDLLDRFYKDVGLPPIQGNHLGILDIKSPGTRVWTRGDGTRHRDPGAIVPSYWSDEPKKGAVVVQKFWQWLQKQPGVRPLGQISGEFGNSKFSDMVGYKGLYFAGGQRGVEFGSASRFKNPRSVWRHNAPEQGVTEGIFDIFKKLPASGSTVKIAGRPVEITHTGGDYIGYTWTDKNGKEHYEETSASNHSNLRSLANTIAAEIKAADDDGVDDALDAQIKGRLDRHFGKKKGVTEGEEQKYRITYDIYGNNKEKPLYTKTQTVRANSEQEAIATLRKLVGGTNHRIEQGVAEGEFDREGFDAHMRKLKARDSLRKTDPLRALAKDMADQTKQGAVKKKASDDDVGINDPRNPSLSALIGLEEGAGNIEVGDKITWWYNKYHPDYQGIVRRVSGNTIIVYAPGSGDTFKLTKDDIRSHKKQNVDEDSDPCWAGYKQIGMKDQAGKKVPNCVPKKR